MQSEKPRYDVAKIRMDMALRGWNARMLAKMAGVSQSGLSQFLLGKIQTAPMAAKVATALGATPRRYLMRERMSA